MIISWLVMEEEEEGNGELDNADGEEEEETDD